MGCDNCELRGMSFSDDQVLEKVSDKNQKLQTNDWLREYEDLDDENKLYEIRFKNTRKGFYLDSNNLVLAKGDIVAVESAYGHDIGTVSLSGKLAWLQFRKQHEKAELDSLKKIYRKATANDTARHKEAMELEKPVMIRSRKIIRELGLEMKLGDVEYQGDKSKAIFYYIADERVDFRELIKVLAREFHIRIEMKQIGARQEAGRIGGIGSCGRELCCSSWRTNFQSVTLNAAKVQDLPANAQKLAGQCGKLKCCLMYELDNYLEAQESMPKVLLELETTQGTAYHHKTDLLKRVMYYSLSQDSPENLISLPVDRVKEIINDNKRGIKVDLVGEAKQKVVEESFDYISSSEAITRFDTKTKKKKGKKKYRKNQRNKS